MKEGIEFAHAHDVKVYVTANILAHNDDLEGVREYFKELKEISRMHPSLQIRGVFQIKDCPEIERHVSTQANNTNYATYLFWYGLGAKACRLCKRVIIAEKIERHPEHIPDDSETVIYPWRNVYFLFGRCLLSNYLPGEMQIREHVHPCR